MDFTQEKDLQNEIANNQSLQRDICSLLDMDFYQTSLFQLHIDNKSFFFIISKAKILLINATQKVHCVMGGGGVSL